MRCDLVIISEQSTAVTMLCVNGLYRTGYKDLDQRGFIKNDELVFEREYSVVKE
jgi:hypothetical protein